MRTRRSLGVLLVGLAISCSKQDSPPSARVPRTDTVIVTIPRGATFDLVWGVNAVTVTRLG